MSMTTHQINPFNHEQGRDEESLVNVHFNGEWIQVPAGLNVVEVAKRQGAFLPHYCYHPKLSISGNCRMCLFEMGMPKRDKERQVVTGEDGKPELMWMPRPMIGCATNVNEGMGIRTDSEMAEQCRKGVMEFLLINHPLDCPICDQAGECKLQEFSSEYGTGESRFVENKVNKPKHVDLGERIVLDDERCVLCTRCVRFSREVMKDDVLGIVNRGSYNAITAHEGKRFDNPYSLNTVDICPVGALTSKDFRFKMRVWFLKETETICTGCGNGCNVVAGSREEVLHRLTPRTNEAVNSHWMCDAGRLGFHYLHEDDRITTPVTRVGGTDLTADWQAIIHELAEKLKASEAGDVAVVASASLTNEELFLLKKLADRIGADLVDVVPRAQEGDGFLRVDDANANTQGAKALGVAQEGKALEAIKGAIQNGKLKGVISWQEDLTDKALVGLTQDDLEKLDFVATTSLRPNGTTEAADYVLAGAGFAEKSGTMVNVHGRQQKLNRAIQVPGKAKEDWKILVELLRALDVEVEGSVEAISEQMAVDFPVFSEANFGNVGSGGKELKLDQA